MILLLCLAVGVGLGVKLLPDRWKKTNDRLSAAAMVLALFCMGVSLGRQPDLLTSLAEAGPAGFCIAAATVAGSVGLVYLVEKRLLPGHFPFRKPDRGEGDAP